MPAAWTTPRTWTAGELVTAAIGNSAWRDNLMYLKSAPVFDSNVTITGTLTQTGVATLTVAPVLSALTGVLKGNGASAVTASAQLAVADGGTGVGTQQAYGVLVGGTTSTGAMQSITPGTSGFVLTSAGTGALPTWAAGGSAVEDQNNILANQVFS